jgi:hypothetical protein
MMSYLATATLAVSLLAAAPKAPQWEPSYGKALKATRAGQDPLLVVLDKPNSDSDRLDPQLLSEGSVEGGEAKLLKPYRLCHVDVSTKYGQKVAEGFHAKSFPHVAIIDKTGSVVIYHKSGKIQQAEWEKALTEHKSGERPAASHPYCPNCQRQQF